MDLITVTRDIAAPPDAVFELVTDLTRMGEWSPENEGGDWTGDATGPALGATFSGKNRNGAEDVDDHVHGDALRTVVGLHVRGHVGAVPDLHVGLRHHTDRDGMSSRPFGSGSAQPG